MVNRLDDIIRLAQIRRTHHAHRLVIGDVNGLCWPGLPDGPTIDLDLVVGTKLSARDRGTPVDADATLSDESVGLSPGAKARVGDELIETSHAHRSIVALHLPPRPINKYHH